LALKQLQAVGHDVQGDKYWEVIDAMINIFYIFFSARFGLRSEILPVLPRSQPFLTSEDSSKSLDPVNKILAKITTQMWRCISSKK
jgi:hypothetical protein